MSEMVHYVVYNNPATLTVTVSADYSVGRDFLYLKKNVKFFPSHKARRAALISVSLALSQTPVYTASL